MLMATTFFENKRDFWSKKPVSKCEGVPFRVTEMSGYRIRAITKAMAHTNAKPPNRYQDRFWEVRQLLAAWNENISNNFICSFVACLDESMSKSLNQWTTPGFIVCPMKPWPFGNECHTIACGVTGILFQLELVEGKDEPPERPQKDYSEHGKTVGLLLRLTKPL